MRKGFVLGYYSAPTVIKAEMSQDKDHGIDPNCEKQCSQSEGTRPNGDLDNVAGIKRVEVRCDSRWWTCDPCRYRVLRILSRAVDDRGIV